MRRAERADHPILWKGAGSLFACFSLSTASFAASLARPLEWTSPDQPWGVRRAVTAADRAVIADYRSGRKTPIFATDFANPAKLEADWNLVGDDNPSLKSCRRPDSVEASHSGLRLKIVVAAACRTARW